jgi:hypothetical protein
VIARDVEDYDSALRDAYPKGNSCLLDGKSSFLEEEIDLAYPLPLCFHRFYDNVDDILKDWDEMENPKPPIGGEASDFEHRIQENKNKTKNDLCFRFLLAHTAAEGFYRRKCTTNAL